MPNIRKSKAIRELSGNPSNRPIPDEPEVANLSFTPPAKMTKRAKLFYKEIAGAMPEGVYKTTDKHLLVAYCEQAASHEEACTKIAEQGAVVEGSQGQPVVSPWVKVRNEAAGKLVTLGARLGLSPADRAAVGTGDGKKETNPFLMN